MHKLKSSSIEHIDHFKDTLEIKFASGALYHYKDCPKEHYEALKEADSAGQYFRQNILGKYDHERKR